jgi:hypothetical protein
MSVDSGNMTSIGFYVRHVILAVALAFILAIAIECVEVGWWHLKRLMGKTASGDQRPLRIWTAPFRRRKPGQ